MRCPTLGCSGNPADHLSLAERLRAHKTRLPPLEVRDARGRLEDSLRESAWTKGKFGAAFASAALVLLPLVSRVGSDSEAYAPIVVLCVVLAALAVGCAAFACR